MYGLFVCSLVRIAGLKVLLVVSVFVNTVDSSTLRLVNLVYRHGDRSVMKTYPTNPNLINETWPEGVGWLTKKGIREQYALGRYLRRRYRGFLSDDYVHSEISVYSSYVERCLMSAYANLAGLYEPDSPEEIWNPKVLWQPIPVRTRPYDQDNTLSMFKECPRYNELYNISMHSAEVLQELVDDKEFYQFVSEKSGVNATNFIDLWTIADTLYCEQEHNVSWPAWVNNTVWDKLNFFRWFGFNVFYNTNDEQRRLKGGALLKEWLDLTRQKIADPESDAKMHMYSAHDSTVVAITSALHIYNKLPPPYAATFIMEVHESNTGDYHVELYFRNKSSTDPNDDTQLHQMTIPDCDFKCPFNKFLSLTAHAVPTDWEADCAAHTSVSPGLSTASPVPCRHPTSAGALSFYSSYLLWLSLVLVWHSSLNC